ncbi:hypothetical protein GECvBGOT_gp018 [Salmonella phage GEC_vB_GOT]|nr:hypothetical protein GECvBGOT_gp018 [Salmonella phage GEC_vB_GOT]
MRFYPPVYMTVIGCGWSIMFALLSVSTPNCVTVAK